MQWKSYLETIILPSSVYILDLSSWVSPWHGMCCGISRKDSQIVNEVNVHTLHLTFKEGMTIFLQVCDFMFLI